MFFRRKLVTLETLDARLTALEMLFDARRHDQGQVPAEGPKPINDVVNAALAGYAKSAGLRMPPG